MDVVRENQQVLPAEHTQSLPSDLPTTIANFVPYAHVHLVGSIAKLPGKRNNFANDQFRNTTRVAERRIEHRDTMLSSIMKIHLICSYAKASNYYEIFRLPQYPSRELRL